jgi:hypothetical protein
MFLSGLLGSQYSLPFTLKAETAKNFIKNNVHLNSKLSKRNPHSLVHMSLHGTFERLRAWRQQKVLGQSE